MICPYSFWVIYDGNKLKEVVLMGAFRLGGGGSPARTCGELAAAPKSASAGISPLTERGK